MKVTQSCPTLCDPMDYIVHGILLARLLQWVAFLFSKGSSQPRFKPRSLTLQVDSLPAEPQGKPKNTGVGSLSLLQQIFLTQELNQGLLHCRLILYQLSFREALLLLKKWENCLEDSYNLPKVTKLPSGKNQYLSPGSKHMVLASLL